MSEYPDIVLAYGESDEYRCGRVYQEQFSKPYEEQCTNQCV